MTDYKLESKIANAITRAESLADELGDIIDVLYTSDDDRLEDALSLADALHYFIKQ